MLRLKHLRWRGRGWERMASIRRRARLISARRKPRRLMNRLAGHDVPHLTYMLSAENREAHEKHWGAFGKHPIWNKMKNDPQYADTVSQIHNRFLVPTAYSQI